MGVETLVNCGFDILFWYHAYHTKISEILLIGSRKQIKFYDNAWYRNMFSNAVKVNLLIVIYTFYKRDYMKIMSLVLTIMVTLKWLWRGDLQSLIVEYYSVYWSCPNKQRKENVILCIVWRVIGNIVPIVWTRTCFAMKYIDQ